MAKKLKVISMNPESLDEAMEPMIFGSKVHFVFHLSPFKTILICQYTMITNVWTFTFKDNEWKGTDRRFDTLDQAIQHTSIIVSNHVAGFYQS